MIGMRKYHAHLSDCGHIAACPESTNPGDEIECWRCHTPRVVERRCGWQP